MLMLKKQKVKFYVVLLTETMDGWMDGGWMNRHLFIIPPLLRYHMRSREANWTWVSEISLYITK